MKLTQNDYFNIYQKFGYIIDILYHAGGALYLKDLSKYTNKSYAQTCKDIIRIEEFKIIKVDIILNSKIISLTRKVYLNYFGIDNKKISRDKSRLKENNLKACIYHNFDISMNEEIKNFLYENYFNLNIISQSFKNQNKHIFNIFDKDNIKFYYRKENKYKVVIRANQIDYKSTKEITRILESIYHLFYILDLNNCFKCEVTVVTNLNTSNYNKKYFFKEVFKHKTKIDYVNKQRKFRQIFCKNFQKKIILKSTQELELSTL